MNDTELLEFCLKTMSAEEVSKLLDDGMSIQDIATACKNVSEKVFNDFNFFTISTLTEEEKTPPEFLVENLIPIGLTFLSGAPKLRKSFLALQLASAVATGTDFLTFKTKRCTVIYFDLEGSKSRISSRSDKMGVSTPDNLLFANNLEFGIAEGLIEQLQNLINVRKDIRLIIIDTYSRARGTFKTNGANAYDSDVQLLAPLQRFAINNKVAVLCVHHDKKNAGFCNDSFERLSGTMGISGSCDSVLNLIGEGKRFSGKATLEYTPRDAKGGELKLMFDDYSCLWKVSELASSTNCFMEWVQSNLPDKGKGDFYAYCDVYQNMFNRYSERPHEAVLKAVKENKLYIFTEFDVAIQTGIKSNDKRGIRLIKL